MNRLFLLPLALLLLCGTAAAQEGKPQYTVTVMRADTLLGEFTLELFPDIAPLHVRNFDSLVSIGFYDSTAFHRVIPGFVIQGGDPNTRSGPQSTWGIGDPSQTNVPAEFNVLSHLRGILSAARSNDPNSATSQFFVVVDSTTRTAGSLDGRYTIYGRVTSGMNIVDSIVLAPTESNQFGEVSRPITKITMQIRRTGIDTTTPEAPLFVGPADDTTRVRGALPIRWSPVPGAILYELQISATPDFATLVQKDSTTALTANARLHQSGLNEYYYRVRASNGGRRGPWSETRSYTTGIATAALGSPLNGTTNVARPVTLVWNRALGATSYRVQVSNSLGFGTLLADQAGLTDTTYTVEGLDPGVRYYWRIQATDGAGDTTVSPRWNFTTSATTGIAPERAASAVRAELRSVGADRYTLHVTSARPTSVSVAIVDVGGRVLSVVARDERTSGDATIAIDAAALASGQYYLHVETTEGTATVAMPVTR
jgi:peptidyl-prolyl cis-trans isomerase B (cyclophilin B)